MENGACKTCRFWDRTIGGQKVKAACMRYPPQAAGVVPIQNLVGGRPQPGIFWGRPEMGPDDWCGDYSAAILQ